MMALKLVSCIAAATVVAVLLSSAFYMPSEQKVAGTKFCLSLPEEEARIGFGQKLPTAIPAGYSFQCAWASSVDGRLMYWNQTLTYGNLSNGTAFEKGAILVMMKANSAKTNPLYRVENRTGEILADYKALGPEKAKLVYLLGNAALVRNECDSCGVQTATKGRLF